MGDLPEYPLSCDDRLDSHFFMAWERRRWLASDMRLNATPECRALFFDLINIAYDNSPVGTLPMDQNILAKLLMIDPGHFGSLCKLDYGPLYKWEACRCDNGDIRLMVVSRIWWKFSGGVLRACGFGPDQAARSSLIGAMG
jgi:hypothetical protein